MKVWLGVGWLTIGVLSGATIRTEALVARGSEVFEREVIERPVTDTREAVAVDVWRDEPAGAFDFAEALVSEVTRRSFIASVSTSSGRENEGAAGIYAEADIFWQSSPLLVSSPYRGSGFIDLGSSCESGPDYGFCESSADTHGLMPVQFNTLTRIWFHLSARSEGNESAVTSRAEAWFNGEILRAFDENMNPVMFGYQYLPESQVSGGITSTPEPTQGLMLISSLAFLALLKVVRLSR